MSKLKIQTNDKVQISNQSQKQATVSVLKLRHLAFILNLDFGICHLVSDATNEVYC
jgi:hypothetical protein